MVAQSGEGGAFEVKGAIPMVSEKRKSARIQKMEAAKIVADQAKKQRERAVLRNRKVLRVNKRRKVVDTPPPVVAVEPYAPPPAADEPSPAKNIPSSGNGSSQPTVKANDSSADNSCVNVADDKGAHARVTETLRVFNKLYLQCVQEEKERCRKLDQKKKGAKSKGEQRSSNKGDRDGKKGKSAKSKENNKNNVDAKRGSQRPDLKATTKMEKDKTILYPDKRHGQIPGIDVGHQFFSRAEMVAIGFHSHWINGIECISKSEVARAEKDSVLQQYSGYKLPLAISIILSGQYEDDLDNCDDITYTGQGGNNLRGDKRQMKDQVLERGNLGLKHCMEQSVPVRVTRGHKCAHSYVGKVYTYDGLYKVVKYWAEKGMSGYTVYKFQLKRVEGQSPLTTNQVFFTRGKVPNSISELRGLVCDDITCGEEDIPIPATNLVDDPPFGPSGFTYIKDLKFAQNVDPPLNAPGCSCKGLCTDPRVCACAKLNGSDFPYVHKNGDRLIEPKAVVFECGPNCGCGPDCINRASQRGIIYQLEVFRTPKKGWGVRSWEFIPSGAPVCEYIGVLMKTDDIDPSKETNYVFDIDCLQTMKGLDGRERRLGDVSLPVHLQKDDSDCAPEFCIDAGCTGNIARFINHSCRPNLFVQCVLSGHHDIKQARVMLIAADNIPPLTELTYDYGYALNSVVGPDGKIREMLCYCGAAYCRKRLF